MFNYAKRHKVSIHASAREATYKPPAGLMYLSFQSTPPRGRRLAAFFRSDGLAQFQSTPPRGRRLVHFNHRAK